MVCFAVSAVLAVGAGPTTYTNSFDATPVGKVPEEFMVLDGPFSIVEVEGNKCLELAGEPIGAFGALFGPTGIGACEVKARVWAAPTGRRFPEFGVGANDAGGYKLMLLPGRGTVELRMGDETVASTRFEWAPSAWTWLKLRVAPADGAWLIQGKLWRHEQEEPAAWTISARGALAPSPGRASVWGNDFSEQPIRFDDLSVTVVK